MLPNKILKSDFAKSLLVLDGHPFSTTAVPYMDHLLDSSGETTIFMTGRQVGKSTTLSASLLVEQLANPHYRSLYVAPRNEQVVQFSKDRLSHMIMYSPIIQKYYVNSKVQQQVRAKEFLNGSMIFLRSCYATADGIRGISANSIFIDEVQDILYENIPVIEECSARKNPKRTIFCGTPKTFDNPIQKIWDNSTQNYWAIKCKHCGHWNVPLSIDNVGREFLCCARCKREIYALDGIYVSKYPDRNVSGFHVSQLMIYGAEGTNLPWSRVIEKLDSPIYGEAKFYNECLGFSYDLGAKLITEGELLQCCNDRPGFTLDRLAEWNMYTVCAGVDWGVLGGNTHTVLTIGGLTPDGTLKVLYMKKYPVDQDPCAQVNEICDTIMKAGATVVCADRGGGHMANSLLRNKLSWSKIHEIEYKGRFAQGMAFNNKSRTWTTDRTRAIAGLILDIKTQKIEFPDGNLCKPYFEDLLTLSCVYNDNIRAYQILRQNDIPDDTAHALTYLRLAARKIAPHPKLFAHKLDDGVSFGNEYEGEDNE